LHLGRTVDPAEAIRLRALSLSELGEDCLGGELPVDQRGAALAASHVLAVGSSYECFQLPIVEAMRTSTLVWAPDSPMMTELGAGSSVTYREGDPVDAAQQLRLSLPEARKLTDIGRHRSMDFTWKACVDKTLEV